MDTINRVDITPIGETANAVAPDWKGPRPGITNYYYPHTAPDGVEGVISYSKVVYEGIYPDIDLILYSGTGGPKMAYVCWPGSDPEDILLLFEGQDSLKAIMDTLMIYLDGKSIELKEAKAYQWNANNTVLPLAWDADYVEDPGGHAVRFQIDTYDPLLPLVFWIGAPPAPGGGGNTDLVWNTTVGNDASTQTGGNGDYIWAADNGTDGSLYTAGHTYDSDYPANPGSLPNVQFADVAVAHFIYNPGQTNDAFNDWTSFVGGSDADKAHALHVASDSAIYVVGWTESADFRVEPLQDPMDGTYWEDSLKGTSDGFILKIAPLNGFLDRSVLFGGNGPDYLTAITEYTTNGNIFLAGNTTSATGTQTIDCTSPSSGLPLCDAGGSSHYQIDNAGGQDVMLVRLSPDFHLTWGTFWGTTEDDQAYDLSQIFDAASQPKGIALVGRTLGTIPTGTQTGYYQSGNGDANGFVATFGPSGVPDWGTNIQGVNGLQAVAAVGTRLIVAGSMQETLPEDISTGCVPAQDSLCLCDPGNGAYMDTVITGGSAAYLAEFRLPLGDLVWATLVDGSTMEEPEFVIEQVEWNDFQPSDHFRNMDLETTTDSAVYFMGLCGQHNYPYTSDYPQVSAWGYYQRPFPTNAGSYQTDVTLHGFTSTRALAWATTYGSMEPTYQSEIADLDHMGHGSDFGHDLVLVEGEALYWVGQTGNWDFEDVCPSTGGYCETQPVLFGDDISDGFIARMDLTDLNIGLAENDQPVIHELAVITIGEAFYLVSNGERMLNAPYLMFDAIGRMVRNGRTASDGSLNASGLAAGHFTVVVQERNTPARATSFVITQ